MKKFYVMCEETCPNCEGKGEVVNTAWEGFNEFEKEQMKALGLESHEFENPELLLRCQGWWAERGYHIESMTDLPWDVAECEDCGGSGLWRHEVDLKDALAELGVGSEAVA